MKAAVLLAMLLLPAAAKAAVLRVCADPDNLPYSSRDGAGFEDRIARLLARDLQARLAYTWSPHRRGFFRRTLKAGACDVVLGVPKDLELVATTRPYYRSTYALVYRRGHAPAPRSLEDPALRRARVGVELVGDDGANAPPVHHLSALGLIDNVVGYPVHARRTAVIDAVAEGTIDVAVAWGPIAGWAARRAPVPLVVVPLASPPAARPPLAFDMAMGVRHGDEATRRRLDAFLLRRQREIGRILDAYGVPR